MAQTDYARGWNAASEAATPIPDGCPSCGALPCDWVESPFHSGWRAGQFMVRTTDGERHIAGWTKGLFALDFRVWEDDADDWFVGGWALSHLPTGYNCAGIISPLAQAFAVADDFMAAADWDFTDVGEAKVRSKQVKALRDKHDGVLIFRTPSFSPLIEGALS